MRIIDEGREVDAADAAITIRLQRLFGAWISTDHFHSWIPVRGRIAPDSVPEETTWLCPVSGAACELVPEFAGPNSPFHIDSVLGILVMEEPCVVSFHRPHKGVGHSYRDIGVTNQCAIPLNLTEIQDIGVRIRDRYHEGAASSLLADDSRGEGVKLHE